jgi:hypothetical protein
LQTPAHATPHAGTKLMGNTTITGDRLPSTSGQKKIFQSCNISLLTILPFGQRVYIKVLDNQIRVVDFRPS